MATTSPPNSHSDEDFIDMELEGHSNSNFLCCSTNSSPQSREFEFQMSSNSNDKEVCSCPADELFYKGKLLPLHLPPRLQMVQKLLHGPISSFETTSEGVFCNSNIKIPFFTNSTNPSTNTSTPLESCNISPSESCRVSCELNPDEYFFEWSTELSSFIDDNDHNSKRSWSKKLKLIKQSSLGQKLKASRTYLKSFFSKSACSDESSAKAASNGDSEQVSKAKEYPNKYMKMSKKNPFGQIGKGTHPTLANVLRSIEKEGSEDGNVMISSHRKSFSAAIKRHSPAKCLSSSSSSSSGASSSSSSFSLTSNGFYELNFLKRSSSATSELEGSIEAAIAHCKQSQEYPSKPQNTFTEADFCSYSANKVVAGQEQERPGLCSI